MIKMTIEVTPEIAVKVAEILGGAGPVPQQAPVPQQLPPTYSAPQTAPIQQPVAPPAQQPVTPPVQAPVQQQAPVQTPPTYSIAQIQQACAPLIDAGKQPDIVNLINSFGVQALTQIPPERLGEFATALRGLGGADMTAPIAHKDRAHALLSASGADRWINCPPSARLEEQFEDTTSDFAREGTLAHEIAELKLRKQFTEPMSARTFNTRLNKLKKEDLYQDEMLGYTDAYLEYIKETVYGYTNTPHIAVEARLDFSHIVPDGFGTGDCLIIGGDTLHVIDFKYGKGVSVSAEDNPQMMLYALGALQKYAMLYGINTIKIVIAQPRLDNISEWEISDTDLVAWGESIKPIAQLAFDGKGDFKAGDHCKFCRAKAQCRARTDTMTALEAFGLGKPPLISDDEVGSILKTAQTLKSWVSDLEEYALKALLSGKKIDGWKAVEGRSNRQFDDTDKAFETIKTSGIDEALLYERKPITLTAIEKLLGKKDFTEILSGHIIKPPGKPTLAPETDKRDAITLQTTAKEAFTNTNINNENGGN